MYSFPELAAIFRNCKTISEITHAGIILLDLMKDGDISDAKKNFILLNMEIRKRQL